MNIKYYSLLFLFTICTFTNTLAQSDTTAFKPSGKIFGTSFFDYSSGLNGNSNASGFDITRALIGYKYKFLPNIQATIAIEGTKDDVYMRNVFASWTNENLKIDVGMMNLKQFNLQQSIWGHRYALKTQQDLIDMGHSVDIGVLATYTFSPILSADISITNGEGHKQIRKDESMKYAIGATVKPIEHFTIRLYGDIYNSDRDQFNKSGLDGAIKNQLTYSAFLGYKNYLAAVGLEYNRQINNGYVKGNNIEAISIYSTVKIHSKWNVYARYDYDNSSSDGISDPWFDNRQMAVVGVEFKPFPFFRFSPNFRNINYSRCSSEQYIFLSGEFNF